ncbi:hypothetical protein CRG98_040669 [Punica granatum]|uniref:Uncharacterized protein n=1 Tax=Punica granatum TaxID=22663 RepID=A0A2I0I4Q7_PUNGR|nr:hypothetical protein CRG98_040669 [Punica granatum]
MEIAKCEAKERALALSFARSTRQGCGKVNSHGLTDPTRLQEARARWLGQLAVQERKLARVSRPGKARLQEARARWLGELAVQESKLDGKVNSHGLADPARLQEARARWLGELAVQESCKRHEQGGSANLRCRKVSSHGLADPARLQKSKLAI